MKKLLLLAILGCALQVANAQDYKKVQTPYLLNQFEQAKTEIDKIAADPKGQNKPETFFWKARVYSTLFKTEATRVKYPESGKVAEEAFGKCMENFAALKADTADLKMAAFDIYSTSFGIGIKNFNTKKWDSAFYNFSRATEYSDIIFSKKWSTSSQPFDTTSILYTGYSAQNAKKMDDAAVFYRRLADAKVKTFGGETLIDIYHYILVNSSDRKDSATFNKYYPICEELYPKETWEDYKFDYISKNYKLSEKAGLYEKENAAGKLDESSYLHFGDIFVNLTKEDKADLDSLQITAYAERAKDAFKNAFNKNNENAIAAFNVGVIYYNTFNTLDDRARANIKAQQEINSSKPVEKDPKKKAVIEAKYKTLLDPLKKDKEALEKPTADAVDGSVEWIERAYNILKLKKDNGTLGGAEKNVYSKSVDFLANLYAYKRDKVRGKDNKLFDEFDAKYKIYDGLHQ